MEISASDEGSVNESEPKIPELLDQVYWYVTSSEVLKEIAHCTPLLSTKVHEAAPDDEVETVIGWPLAGFVTTNDCPGLILGTEIEDVTVLPLSVIVFVADIVPFPESDADPDPDNTAEPPDFKKTAVGIDESEFALNFAR